MTMTVQTFVIDGKLLGRNEREYLARSHWAKANAEKKRETELAAWAAKQAGLKPIDRPCEVSIIYREQDQHYKNGKRKKRRDVDNVQDGCKPILDGLVRAGILPDDSPEWVRRVIPTVIYGDVEPHITVALMDYEPNRVIHFTPVMEEGA